MNLIYFDNQLIIKEKVGSIGLSVTEKIEKEIFDAILKAGKKVKKKKKKVYNIYNTFILLLTFLELIFSFFRNKCINGFKIKRNTSSIFKF